MTGNPILVVELRGGVVNDIFMTDGTHPEYIQVDWDDIEDDPATGVEALQAIVEALQTTRPQSFPGKAPGLMTTPGKE